MTYTIVGVTGHIDHGKTTLVRVLTGVDTDTDPEEKRRGITIDLGFATFRVGEHQFALIDAPGHQKYIGNLLAGVSAIDLGLLIVACDQGIQHQTLEHAAIVRALGVRNLIVAISRIDLANDSVVAELAEELQVFLDDFGFDEIPIIPFSSVTGVGIDQLKSLMCDYARRKDSAEPKALNASDFRLPVDRVFNVPGRGLVLAGTIWSGEVRIGDMLEIAGTNVALRVRELEVHGESVESSVAGYRTAVNLAGGSGVDVQRGDELVTPGTHRKSDRLIVVLNMFSEASEIRCPATVQMHTATQCCSVRILGAKQLLPGSQTVVVVEPDVPIVANYSQACLFRRPYPVGSFAGGSILAGFAGSHAKTKNLVALGRQLQSADAAERLVAWVDFFGEMKLDEKRSLRELGIATDEITIALQTVVTEQSVIRLDDRLVSLSAAQAARRYIIKIFEARIQKNAEDAWIVESSIVERASSLGSSALISWTIDQLVGEKQLVRLNNLLAIASEHTSLSKKQRTNIDHLIALYANSRNPPTLKEAAEQLHLTLDSASSIMRFATQQQLLIDLGNGFHISMQMFRLLCQELQSLFEADAELSVAAIRDRWLVTRKHAIPLLEYCDRAAITVRHDTLRTAGPELAKYCNVERTAKHAAE